MPTPKSPNGLDGARTSRVRRIIAVDAHPVVRHGVARIVAAEPDLELVAEAGNRREAQAAIAQHVPELVVAALELGSEDGLELVTWIRHSHEGTRVLVLSSRDPLSCGERALRAGALGFIRKEAPAHDIVFAIREVLAGRVYAPPELTERVMSAVSGRRSSRSDEPLDVLSDRELQIFEHLGQGRSTREIAAVLGLSVKTIASHRANIQNKLVVTTLSELVRRAVLWVERRGEYAGAKGSNGTKVLAAMPAPAIAASWVDG